MNFINMAKALIIMHINCPVRQMADGAINVFDNMAKANQTMQLILTLKLVNKIHQIHW